MRDPRVGGRSTAMRGAPARQRRGAAAVPCSRGGVRQPQPRRLANQLTDNDFAKVNGVTTTLRAVLAHAPSDVTPHVYTLSDDEIEETGYSALRSRGVPIPFYGEMRMYAPRLALLRERLAADRVAGIHLTTPGPAGLASRWLARTLDRPLIGSYHTELGQYAARLSGSPMLGSLMQSYMRWLYGPCTRGARAVGVHPCVARGRRLGAGTFERLAPRC